MPPIRSQKNAGDISLNFQNHYLNDLLFRYTTQQRHSAIVQKRHLPWSRNVCDKLRTKWEIKIIKIIYSQNVYILSLFDGLVIPEMYATLGSLIIYSENENSWWLRLFLDERDHWEILSMEEILSHISSRKSVEKQSQFQYIFKRKSIEYILWTWGERDQSWL